MNRPNRAFAIACFAGLAVSLAGCATTNNLDRFDFAGATLAADMPLPPEPRMQVHYEVILDRHEPIYSAFSVLTGVAKATQAEDGGHAGGARRRRCPGIIPERIIRCVHGDTRSAARGECGRGRLSSGALHP